MYPAIFTGVQDMDKLIILETDSILQLIDLYRTDKSTYTYLNTQEVLEKLALKFELPAVTSFRDLVKEYELMLIRTTKRVNIRDRMTHLLKICSDNDAVGLLRLAEENIPIPTMAYGDEDGDLDYLYNHHDNLLQFCEDCITSKSYKCLEAVGPWITRVSGAQIYYFDGGDTEYMTGHYEHVSDLLELSVKTSDLIAAKVLLEWDSSSLELFDICKATSRALEISVDMNLVDFFDLLSSHCGKYDVKLILRSLSNLMDPDMPTTGIMAIAVIGRYNGLNESSVQMEEYERLLYFLEIVPDKDVRDVLNHFIGDITVADTDEL